MKVVVDTDVVLDLLLDREPFAAASAALFAAIERDRLTGAVCATTVTTVFYIAAKAHGRAKAREAVRRLLTLVDVAPVGRPVIEAALNSRMADFEDAVISASAQSIGADAVVTRNVRDFRGAPQPAHPPDALLKLLDLSDPT